MELIFVAALIVIIVSSAAPRFSGTFNSLRTQDFISDITSFARYAQARAVIEGTEKRLIFDREKKIFGVDGYHKGQEEEGYWNREKSRRIPDFISLDLKGKEKIRFYPDGTAEETFIGISVPSIDKNCLISIEAGTGYVKVEEVKQ